MGHTPGIRTIGPDVVPADSRARPCQFARGSRRGRTSGYRWKRQRNNLPSPGRPRPGGSPRLSPTIPPGCAGPIPRTVELRLTTEARYDGIPHRQPELSGYIDMNSWGTDRSGPDPRDGGHDHAPPAAGLGRAKGPGPQGAYVHGTAVRIPGGGSRLSVNNSRARRYGSAPLAGLTGGRKLNGFLDCSEPPPAAGSAPRLWRFWRGGGVLPDCDRVMGDADAMGGSLRVWEAGG